jgi:hypothetical protein
MLEICALCVAYFLLIPLTFATEQSTLYMQPNRLLTQKKYDEDNNFRDLLTDRLQSYADSFCDEQSSSPICTGFLNKEWLKKLEQPTKE